MIDCIYNSDSIFEIKKLDSNSIHAIISDIPYGIDYDDWDILHSNTNSALGGTSSAQHKTSLFKRRGKPLNGWSEADKKRPQEYQEWVESWSNEWFRVLKSGSSVFVFAGRQFAHRVVVAFENSGFTFKDMLSWEKTKLHIEHKEFLVCLNVEVILLILINGLVGELLIYDLYLSLFYGFKTI